MYYSRNHAFIRRLVPHGHDGQLAVLFRGLTWDVNYAEALYVVLMMN